MPAHNHSTTYYGEPLGQSMDMVYEIGDKIEREIQKYMSSGRGYKEGRIEGRIRYLEMEMNGYREIVKTKEDILRFLYERMRHETR